MACWLQINVCSLFKFDQMGLLIRIIKSTPQDITIVVVIMYNEVLDECFKTKNDM
jgi:hypothetical protein